MTAFGRSGTSTKTGKLAAGLVAIAFFRHPTSRIVRPSSRYNAKVVDYDPTSDEYTCIADVAPGDPFRAKSANVKPLVAATAAATGEGQKVRCAATAQTGEGGNVTTKTVRSSSVHSPLLVR